MIKPTVIFSGDVGIDLGALSESRKTQLEWLLTVTSKPFKNNPAVTITGHREENGYLWIPRQFAIKQGFTPDQDLTLSGKPQDLDFKVKLDPNRGQVEAVPAMVEHLRRFGAGILIAPTGTGKTLLSYCIGSRFNTSIGILVYAGHMIDNWIEQADLAFGIKPEDIGLVQQDRCDLGKPITIFSIQSLLSRRYPEELYNQIGFLVADEIPRYGAEQWNQVIRQFPAKWRLGVAAEASRPDGLEQVIEWNFGNIGHTIKQRTVILTVVRTPIATTYSENSYKDFTQSSIQGQFVADSLRYDKKLAKDPLRNKIIVEELIKARKQGRKVLMFSRLRDHLDELKALFEKELEVVRAKDPEYPPTVTDYLVGGMKKAARESAMLADIKFATYSFCRDAMNDTSIDTVFFCTPPGNPLQPAGRLRDKGPTDRKPLMVVAFTEDTLYSEDKWERNLKVYNRLGFKVVTVKKKSS